MRQPLLSPAARSFSRGLPINRLSSVRVSRPRAPSRRGNVNLGRSGDAMFALYWVGLLLVLLLVVPLMTTRPTRY
jgi:hypothetical protein